MTSHPVLHWRKLRLADTVLAETLESSPWHEVLVLKIGAIMSWSVFLAKVLHTVRTTVMSQHFTIAAYGTPYRCHTQDLPNYPVLEPKTRLKPKDLFTGQYGS